MNPAEPRSVTSVRASSLHEFDLAAADGRSVAMAAGRYDFAAAADSRISRGSVAVLVPLCFPFGNQGRYVPLFASRAFL